MEIESLQSSLLNMMHVEQMMEGFLFLPWFGNISLAGNIFVLSKSSTMFYGLSSKRLQGESRKNLWWILST